MPFRRSDRSDFAFFQLTRDARVSSGCSDDRWRCDRSDHCAVAGGPARFRHADRSPSIGARGLLGRGERFLRSLSHCLWPELSERLGAQTGIDNGHRRCGAVVLAEPGEDLEQKIAAWRAEGITVERLIGRGDLERCIPGLHSRISDAALLPDFCQVRNPRHLKALRAACQLSGVELLENVSDVRLVEEGRRFRVECPMRRLMPDRICLTAGAWTPLLLRNTGIDLPVFPVRGQIVQLQVAQLPFRCVLEQGRQYLVPRADGLILVGSTEERAGFEKRTTGNGVRGLLEFAASVVPELGEAEPVRQWAGLRPGSPDGLPYLGRISGYDNLYIAAGHFRNGLQMSPGTAAMLVDALLDSNTTAVVIFPDRRNHTDQRPVV